jgi:hypothetical protein
VRNPGWSGWLEFWQPKHTQARPTRRVLRTLRIPSGWLAECTPLATTTSSWPSPGFMTSSRTARASALDLTSLGFPSEVVNGVVAMTTRRGDEGTEAVERAPSNRLGLVCKAADVADNTDTDRQALLASGDPAIVVHHQRKYAMCREVLKEHGGPAF